MHNKYFGINLTLKKELIQRLYKKITKIKNKILCSSYNHKTNNIDKHIIIAHIKIKSRISNNLKKTYVTNHIHMYINSSYEKKFCYLQMYTNIQQI